VAPSGFTNQLSEPLLVLQGIPQARVETGGPEELVLVLVAPFELDPTLGRLVVGRAVRSPRGTSVRLCRGKLETEVVLGGCHPPLYGAITHPPLFSQPPLHLAPLAVWRLGADAVRHVTSTQRAHLRHGREGYANIDELLHFHVVCPVNETPLVALHEDVQRVSGHHVLQASQVIVSLFGSSS